MVELIAILRMQRLKQTKLFFEKAFTTSGNKDSDINNSHNDES